MIVVGVDGANRQTLVEPARRGALPNFGELLDDGVGGDLWSVTTSSAAAWTAHITGVPPEDGGITSFVTDDRFVETTDIAVRTYPELLDEAGYRVGLVNVPLTYPPLSLENGFCVPGQLTPLDAEEYAEPPVLHDVLDDVDYEVDVQYGDRQYSFVDPDLEVDRQTLLEDVHRVETKRLAAARRLVAEYEWDLFFVLVNGTDPMQHFFWDQITDAPLEETDMYRVYQLIDDFVGDVRADYPEENVLLFSDHGFREDVWGTDDATRARWSAIRSVGSRLMPDRLKQTRVRQLAVDLLARGAAATAETGGDRPPGSHDPAATWLLGGPDVVATEGDRERQYLDLPATILHVLGASVPEAYPGSVPEDLLAFDRPVERSARDISVDRERRHADEPPTEQLSHLGYVEMVESDGE